MTPKERNLLEWIRQAQDDQPDGYVRSLFRVAVELEHPYNNAWAQLRRLERAGLVEVERGRQLRMRAIAIQEHLL